MKLVAARPGDAPLRQEYTVGYRLHQRLEGGDNIAGRLTALQLFEDAQPLAGDLVHDGPLAGHGIPGGEHRGARSREAMYVADPGIDVPGMGDHDQKRTGGVQTQSARDKGARRAPGPVHGRAMAVLQRSHDGVKPLGVEDPGQVLQILKRRCDGGLRQHAVLLPHFSKTGPAAKCRPSVAKAAHGPTSSLSLPPGGFVPFSKRRVARRVGAVKSWTLRPYGRHPPFVPLGPATRAMPSSHCLGAPCRRGFSLHG